MSYVFFDPPDRRMKVFWITPELLLNALFSPQRNGDEIRLIHITGIPQGAKVQAVTYSDDHRAFGFRIWHESFEEISEACTMETLSVTCREEILHVREETKQDEEPKRGREFI